MERNLPIKLFKKRDNDKALNNLPGGFDTQGAKFRLEGEELTERVNYFKGYFGQLKSKITQKAASGNYLPTVNKYYLA